MSVRILIGDMREKLRDLPDNSVDSVACDPPYHLTSIVKRFGSENAAPAKVGKTGAYARASKGFMGQTWDGGDVAFQPETWAEVLRVLKPGGHLVAFSGTRTYHRMAVAIEDAGFEVRDMISYHYGSGFPKSHNINKALHGKELVCSCGSSQVPQYDLRLVPNADVSSPLNTCEAEGQILLPSLPEQSAPTSRRSELPAAEVRQGQSGVERRRLQEAGSRQLSGREVSESAGMGEADGEGGRLHDAASASHGSDVRLPADANGGSEPQGSQPREQSSVEPGAVADECGSQARGEGPVCRRCGKPVVQEGLGTALKPATEPICLARKPISESSIAANVLKWGTGALNIDGCRIEPPGEVISNHGHSAESGQSKAVYGDFAGIEPHQKPGQALGRWPANLVHDGSDEVVAGFPETESGTIASHHRRTTDGGNGNTHGKMAGVLGTSFGDSGSAARFFYCAKATTEERGEGNSHPTVKPVALMRWLVRLVTPKGGTCLDPFMGSGSTALACDAEQFDFIGCELSPEYAAIAERRIRDAAGMFADVKVAA